MQKQAHTQDQKDALASAVNDWAEMGVLSVTTEFALTEAGLDPSQTAEKLDGLKSF